MPVNMLYLDQPVQTGFSYGTLHNITTDLISGNVTVLNETDHIPEQNATFLVGIYSSQDSNSTALGTRNAAIALWHFAQVWFQEFPCYHPNNSRISLAVESYGGRYGPAFASFFEEQNQRIENGSFFANEGEKYIINLDTLLIVNGCIDRLVQWPSYPQQAYNNTYGIQTVNESTYHSMINALYRPGGCEDKIYECRNVSLLYDPDSIGINSSVNNICAAAEAFCVDNIRRPYQRYSGRNYYDIGIFDPDPYPFPFYEGYLNQPHVQAALGVPLNYTQSSSAVSRAFRSIGDYDRPGWLEDLTYILESGIRVTLMYGDRDFACNWIGGEAVSLAINYTHTSDFRAAVYEPIQTNDSYVGGQVRQYGNLSFSRVYQAGHELPFYQPETAYRIFNRALFNLDIGTGTNPVTSSNGSLYSSKGAIDTMSIKNTPPQQPLQYCYVLDPQSYCTDDQISSIQNGTAVIRDYILMDVNSTQLFPEMVEKWRGGGGAGWSGGGDGGGGGGGGYRYGAGFALQVPSMIIIFLAAATLICILKI
jgi:carboxypeptidase C (cathepsin A)